MYIPFPLECWYGIKDTIPWTLSGWTTTSFSVWGYPWAWPRNCSLCRTPQHVCRCQHLRRCTSRLCSSTTLAAYSIPDLIQGFGAHLQSPLWPGTYIPTRPPLTIWAPQNITFCRSTPLGDPWPKRCPTGLSYRQGFFGPGPNQIEWASDWDLGPARLFAVPQDL